MRAQVLDKGVRADGRRCDEVRPITIDTSCYRAPMAVVIHSRHNPSSFGGNTWRG